MYVCIVNIFLSSWAMFIACKLLFFYQLQLKEEKICVLNMFCEWGEIYVFIYIRLLENSFRITTRSNSNNIIVVEDVMKKNNEWIIHKNHLIVTFRYKCPTRIMRFNRYTSHVEALRIWGMLKFSPIRFANQQARYCLTTVIHSRFSQ
jgi:hypothetical protein